MKQRAGSSPHILELRRRALAVPFAASSSIAHGVQGLINDNFTAQDAGMGIREGLVVLKSIDTFRGCIGVWLASVMLWRPKTRTILDTFAYDRTSMQRARALLRGMLAGVGAPELERGFRTPLAVCAHRAMTEREAEQLRSDWQQASPMDPLESPVEVLWETPAAKPTPIAALPCRQPTIQQTEEMPILVECTGCDTCWERQKAGERAAAWQPPAPLIATGDTGLVDPLGQPIGSGDA